jgi:Skp family chaperone for outer membrane proteins
MNRVLAVAFAFLFAFSIHSFGQAAPAGPAKIVLINSNEFVDEKAGITRYISTVKTLNAEFQSADAELRTMNTRLQTINKELEAARTTPNPQQSLISAKLEEGDKLAREIKFKSDDAKARYQRREQTLLGPVMQDIYKALQEFSKAKGYSVVLDIAKDQAGFVAALGDEKVVVTKDFIAFYNARSASVPMSK